MLVHLNGQLVAPDRAAVSVFDRGFLFGDGVYEGIRACEGAIVAMDHHLDRMRAGLEESRITGFDPACLTERTEELLSANNLRDASIYWQVTRGAPTSFQEPGTLRGRIPAKSGRYEPTVFGYVAPLPALSAYTEPLARSALAVPDTRWLRGHLKSISLMGGVLAAYEAGERGFDDAIFLRDGFVTEGVATNVLVSRGGRVLTPPDTHGRLLSGVTRRLLLDADRAIEERAITERDLREADEVMLIGTFTMLVSVTKLDGAPVGDGRVGPVARRLLSALVATIREEIATRQAPPAHAR